MTTFDEWMKANYATAGGAPLVARSAWGVAVEQCAKLCEARAEDLFASIDRGEFNEADRKNATGQAIQLRTTAVAIRQRIT